MARSAGVHALVRRTHEERVLRVLREHGAMSRRQIALAVGLSRTTLSEITGSLLQRGAIVVVDTDADRREGSGRPAERLALDPASGQFMGIDFGHRRVRLAVADASHEIVLAGSERYDDAPWHVRLDLAFRLIDRLSAESGVHFGALQGVGIGVPGPYRAKPGVLVTPPREAARERARETVRDAAREAVREAAAHGTPEAVVQVAFAARFGAPVIVDNNTRLAALAEAVFGRSSVENLLYLRISDGVGGGLVVGGRLVTGSSGLAGELGHVTADPDGLACRCGKRGCVETLASVPALLRTCRERGLAVADLGGLAAAVERGDPVADRTLRAAGAAVGRVLGTASLILDPGEIVIGGEVTRVAPVLLEEAAAAIAAANFPGGSAPVVRRAELSDDDGALGALAALFHSSPLLAAYPEAPEANPAGTAPIERARKTTSRGVAYGRAQ
ncbi:MULTISPECIES: ROK family transcriptional regulator [Actinomadura]|uniref:ROK family transcriptional regulator n=1 Tax=Actinomadura TaxID=1988 RepID=UPI0003F796F8|nr:MULTISPECIES: ROK family transcriptional regulator [Actinomadura]RSN71590.1 ROK family transcriptional regulator [Actinomadura sp. WAC 06369]